MQHPRKPPNRHKLTAATVAQLQPDTHLRGLAVVVQPSGHKAWVVVYQFMRRSRWYTLGNADVISLADARKLAAHVLNKVYDGKDPAAEKRAVRSADTFAELSERYLSEHAKREKQKLETGRHIGHPQSTAALGQASRRHNNEADVKAMMTRCASLSCRQPNTRRRQRHIHMGHQGRRRRHQA